MAEPTIAYMKEDIIDVRWTILALSWKCYQQNVATNLKNQQT